MTSEQRPISMQAYRWGLSVEDQIEVREELDKALDDLFSPLSPRQRQVWRLKMNFEVEGFVSNEEIARQLGISRRTVRTHIQRGQEKMATPRNIISF